MGSNKWAFCSPWNPTDSKFWHAKLGPKTEWIKLAFRTTDQLDPNAELILNDLGIEIPGERLYDRNKAEKVFSLIEKMHNEDLPVAIGF